jgi:alanine racemase
VKSTSYIELDRAALRRNVKYLQKRIGSARFCSVVKGDAYGHGIEEFLPLVEECGVDFFAVADAFEAEKALEVKRPGSHVMIMAMLDDHHLEWAVENDISFYVFDMDRLRGAVRAARKVGRPARVHLEVETGLNRTGFEECELEEVAALIGRNPDAVRVDGLCTHYAGAENVANYRRIIEQFGLFKKRVKWFTERGIQPVYRHTACSAAALTYPQTVMDMVRFGIAQYGFWPSKETRMYNLLSDDTTFTVDPLHQVLSWKSRVMAVKPVGRGKFVGYGTSFLTTNDMRLAVIPVGYFHGFSRSLSNLGHVLIGGYKCRVVGMVNMNMFMVNVTHVPGAKRGDEVVLIGKQGHQHISVASFSEMSSYVNYELLTHLPSDIPRLVVG